MSLQYAWAGGILACLPILKGSACTNTSKDWQAQRSMALYHSAMAHIMIIPELNDICAKDDYYRFADKHSLQTSCARAADFGTYCEEALGAECS